VRREAANVTGERVAPPLLNREVSISNLDTETGDFRPSKQITGGYPKLGHDCFLACIAFIIYYSLFILSFDAV
jgi:hypothetical protein